MNTPRAGAAGRVRATPPPSASRLAGEYAGADLVDSFTLALSPRAPNDAYQLARRMLTDPPPWFGGLMGLRDSLMRPFGVKTSDQMRRAATGDGRDRVSFFPVLSRSPLEVVLGDDDSHLDFRMSILVSGPSGEQRITATTVVRCHNALGRLYLRVIQPFHIVVVQAQLRRLGRGLR